MVFRRSIGAVAGLSLAALAASASGGCNSSSGGAGLASTCAINSDCNSPLVCAFSKCHSECADSRDCPTGQRCVVSGATGICQLPAETTCTGTGGACQTGQVCDTTDQQCRMACSNTVSCITGDYCVTIGAAGAPGTCYSASTSADESTLVTAGVLSSDGAVLEDASAVTLTSDGSVVTGTSDGATSDGAGSTTADGATGTDGAGSTTADGAGGTGSSGASDGSGGGSSGMDATVSTPSDAGGSSGSGMDATITVNTCPTAQTSFGNTAQGDSNPNFTSGLGVRTNTSLLMFSGYSGPDPTNDAGDGGTVNLVYVQAFDPTTANALGPAKPLFSAPAGSGFVLESASIAPTGEIAIAFNYGGGYPYNTNNGNEKALYAAFLAPSVDAGPAAVALQRAPIEIETAQLTGQPHVIWSVATGAFIFSWSYYNGNWFLGTKFFRPNGQAAGGVDPVPTDSVSAAVYGDASRAQGSVAAGPNLFGVAFRGSSSIYPSLTILDLSGNEIGSPFAVAEDQNYWEEVAATAQGFVYLYDRGGAGVAEVFVPTSADAGAAIPDAGLSGFNFTGAIGAYDARAISDDTGGLGGVGVALLYGTGLSFAYVQADGMTHIGPLSVIAHTYANYDQMNITNFGGSFGVSLYSVAMQSTQMAASGCQ